MKPLPVSSRDIIMHFPQAVIVTDKKGTILAVNPVFTQITGYKEEEALGETPRILKSGLHNKKFYDEMWASIDKTGYWEGEIRNRKKTGEFYTEWLTIQRIKTNRPQVDYYLGVFSDITKQKITDHFFKRLAYYDPLTRLPNRTLFQDRLKQALASAKRSGGPSALLYLDLDHLKKANDTQGHEAGDCLLQTVAKRLKHCVRQTDTVARIGGDEFIILLSSLKNTQDVNRAAKKILETVKMPFMFNGKTLGTTASIGISLFPKDGTTAVSLIKNADTAMYKAKQEGKNRFFYFSSRN